MAPFKDFSITLYVYECELIKGDLTLIEHIEKAWKSKEEILNMNFTQADIPLIKLLK